MRVNTREAYERITNLTIFFHMIAERYFRSQKPYPLDRATKYCLKRNGTLVSIGKKEKYLSLQNFIYREIRIRNTSRQHEMVWTNMVYQPIHVSG